MSKWVPIYFAKDLDSLAKEVLSPTLYKHFGVVGLRKFDQRILMFLDEFRKDCDTPLTVNTPWNEQFTQSGLRDFKFYDNSCEKYFWSLSDHTRGGALDIKCKYGGAWLRKKFIEKEQYYYEKYGVCFVETGPLKNGSDMSWAHFSVRFDFHGEVKYWSPKLGYVTKEQVLEDNL